ncbi:MAG TPA: M56 family metallopeptidase, partial [Gemmatimonadaceae bacterium]
MSEQVLVIVIEAAIRATALAALVAALLWLLRVPRGALRHSAWLMVVVAMLLMPGLQRLTPALPAPFSPGVPDVTALLAPREPAAAPPMASPSLPASPSSATAAQTGPLPPIAPGTTNTATGLPIPWMALAGALYLVVALFLLLRLALALRTVGVIIRHARPLGEGLWESPAVVTPVTVGVIRPRILLPAAWTEWPGATRDAVIAHERAHVTRRDPLVALIARLNTCVFWFHPLAWWLERAVADAAEQACDELAVREVSHPRQYAEALLTMATAARQAGGRIAWAGVRAEGSGRLSERIDRILGGTPAAAVSRARKVVTVACVGSAIVVAACRQQSSPTPLREDPELAKRLTAGPANTKRFEAARDMTQEQADALEQRIATNPEDFETRQQLVTYYATSSKVAWDRKVPGLRRHALWLIEHHPDHDVGAPALSPDYDPAGFAAAKTLWEAHLARPDASPFLVYRAASFFAPHDKPYAEQLIRRGMAMDPDSAALTARFGSGYGGYEWPIQLSSLYASALRGSHSVWGTYNDLRTRADKLDLPYAME